MLRICQRRTLVIYCDHKFVFLWIWFDDGKGDFTSIKLLENAEEERKMFRLPKIKNTSWPEPRKRIPSVTSYSQKTASGNDYAAVYIKVDSDSSKYESPNSWWKSVSVEYTKNHPPLKLSEVLSYGQEAPRKGTVVFLPFNYQLRFGNLAFGSSNKNKSKCRVVN